MTRTGKIITAALALLVAAAAIVWCTMPQKSGGGTYDELIENGNAENGKSGWSTSAYLDGSAYTEFSVREGEGMDGGAAFHIRNIVPNDARFEQTVSVSPDTLYCLSAFIRADSSETVSSDGKTPRGANISVEGIYVFSESVFRSDEWREVRLYGRTGPDQTSMKVYIRLGGYSGESIGEAWFDNVSVRRVDAADSGYSVWNLYSESQPAPDGTENTAAGTAQFVLILAAMFFIAAVCFSARYIRRDTGARKPYAPFILAGIILLGLAVRLVIALTVRGYDVDVNDFRLWADRVYAVGPTEFYGSTWCDYPPGYVMILWVLGWIGHFFGGTGALLVKLPSIFCDLFTAALVYYAARRKGAGQTGSLILCALYAFNPVTLLCGAAWGQGDSVMTFLLMIVVLLGVSGNWLGALPVYGLAVLVKPQSLMFGPLGLAAMALEIIHLHRRKDHREAMTMLGRTAGGLGIMAAAMLCVVLPFSIRQGGLSWLIQRYADTMNSYGQATVNGCNWYYLFGFNWSGVDDPAHLPTAAACLLTVLLPPAASCLYMRRPKKELRITCCACGALFLLLLAETLIRGLSWRAFGLRVIVLCVLLTAAMYLKGGRSSHLPLCGAAFLCLMFSSATMMHERYLFPAAMLTMLAYLEERDKRVLWAFALVSAACFLNAGCVLDRNIRIGGAAGHLNAPAFGIESDMSFAEALSALSNILAALGCSLLMCFKCVPEKEPLPWPDAAAQRTAAPQARFSFMDAAAARLVRDGSARRTDRKDAVIIAACTAVYCVLAFTNLGSLAAPQNACVMKPGEQAVLDLGSEKSFLPLVYQGIHYTGIPYTLEVSSDGENYDSLSETTATEGDCFKWRYVFPPMTDYFTGRYLRITSKAAPGEYSLGADYLLTLFEVVLRDENGNVLPVTASLGAENLVDEQDTLTGEPDWFNSAYFDEIYHARTGYELNHRLRIYEWTHPPLGKILMSLCISVFGMTPFGWRFAGAFMGVLMLPAMYLTGRLLFKKRLGGIGAMGLMLLDFMHFTQTRIATIDSFVVCFIIWSYYFMLRWFLKAYWSRPFWKTLMDLALSGLFIALAIASKWTGCYAAVGLAVIFFWGLGRRILEVRAAKAAGGKDPTDDGIKALAPAARAMGLRVKKVKVPDPSAAKDRPEGGPAALAAQSGVMRLSVTVASCFGFFVFVPLLVYYLSYIPFLRANGSLTGSLGENIRLIIIQCQGMLSYHSTPGLGMDHYFYSPWYEWPIIKTPMWYFSTTYAPEGFARTIVSFGNPAVWWTGGAAMLCLMGLLAWRLLRRVGAIPEIKAPESEKAPQADPDGTLIRDEKDPSADVSAPGFTEKLYKHIRSLFWAPLRDDPVPLLILISFLAQYLPWVLVSRGTYIYHYFPSVPFIILAAVFFFCRAAEKRKKAAVIALCVLFAAALILFAAFFPYISGVTASRDWLQAMKWFPNWLFF